MCVKRGTAFHPHEIGCVQFQLTQWLGAFDPSGRWLLGANQDSDSVAIFKVNIIMGSIEYTSNLVLPLDASRAAARARSYVRVLTDCMQTRAAELCVRRSASEVKDFLSPDSNWAIRRHMNTVGLRFSEAIG